MNNPIILTAQQTAELHTTGRLTGYREKCEWQPPTIKRCIVGMDSDGQWFSLYEEYTPNGWVNGEKKLTPPRDTATTYAVKEPCLVDDVKTDQIHEATKGAKWIAALVTYPSELGHWESKREWKDCPKEYADNWFEDIELQNHDGTLKYSPETMPDWAVRQHARITDIKLIIESGELWWDMDLEKVG